MNKKLLLSLTFVVLKYVVRTSLHNLHVYICVFCGYRLAPVFFVCGLMFLLWSLYTFNFLIPLYLSQKGDVLFERYGESTEWYACVYGAIFHAAVALMLVAYYK